MQSDSQDSLSFWGTNQLMTSKHVRTSCKCSPVVFDPAASGATVPLVDCSRNPPALVDAMIPESRGVRRYVFISHVRSEGLGNDLESSIPYCQLARLRGYVEKLYDDALACVPFWIDTACIPIKKDIRKSALEEITNIVKSADKVLVLDSTLLNIVPESASICLNAVRNSPWKKRVWTIKEGALARSLWFFFSTGPIAWSDILRQTQEGNETPVWANGLPTKPSDVRQGDTFSHSEGLEQDLDLLEKDIENCFGQGKEPLEIPQVSRLEKYKMRAFLRLAYLSLPCMQPLATDDELRRFPRVKDTMREVYMKGSSKGLSFANRILRIVTISEQLEALGVPEDI